MQGPDSVPSHTAGRGGRSLILKSLRVINYASHADTALENLSPITVLVGPNGAGKSSLFEGIRTLSRILTGTVGQAFGPPPYSFNDRRFAGATQQRIEFNAVFGDRNFDATTTYRIAVGYTGRENVGSPPTILTEEVSVADHLVFDRSKKLIDIAGLSAAGVADDASLLATIRAMPRGSFKGPQVLESLARRVGSVVNYRLEPRQLSRPSQEPDPEDRIRLGYEGENLAALLFWLNATSPHVIDVIVNDMQSVIPNFAGIYFNSIGVDKVGFALEFDDDRRRVLAPNASSGTLLLLGLITLLHAPSHPDIACLEEPETGLTPDAVRLFLTLLCKSAAGELQSNRSQFFFSTHSPFVLVDAWNQLEEHRHFIKRLHVEEGRTVIEDLQSIIDRGNSGLVLQKGKDGRTILGLKAAEELLCGRFLD